MIRKGQFRPELRPFQTVPQMPSEVEAVSTPCFSTYNLRQNRRNRYDRSQRSSSPYRATALVIYWFISPDPSALAVIYQYITLLLRIIEGDGSRDVAGNVSRDY